MIQLFGRALAGRLLLAMVSVVAFNLAAFTASAETEEAVLEEPADGKSLGLGAEVFGGWQAAWREDDSFNAWELDRAELQGRWSATPDVGLVVIAEVVRAAGPRGFFGVDGDSLVARLKQGWAFAGRDLGPVVLEARAGLIPDVWIEAIEADYWVRGFAATLSEAGQFFDTSDLGGSLHAGFFEDRLRLAVSLTNGEGRNLREQNRGKNITGLVSYDLWRADTQDHRLSLYLGARDGSVGAASAPDHRLAAGASYISPVAGGGAEWVVGRGYAGHGSQEPLGFGAWGWVRPWQTFPGAVVRADRLLTDRHIGDSHRTVLQVGLFQDLVPPASRGQRMRAYLAYDRSFSGEFAAPLPGVPEAADEQRLSFLFEFSIHHFWE